MRTILHTSDLHFGPKFLPPVAEGLERLIDGRRPDLLVVAGDLTQRAKPRQFREAREWLQRQPVPVLAVPGNHDVPMYRFWERIFAPFGAWQRHLWPEREPVYEDDELLVVSINTAFNWTIKNGRVTEHSLQRVVRRLRRAPDERYRVVVAHHPLAPPCKFPDQGTARHAARAAEALARAGAELVLGGHFHVTYLRPLADFRGATAPELPVLHAGTTTSSRGREWERGVNSCNWLEIGTESIEVSQLVWDRDEFAPSGLTWQLPRRAAGDLAPAGQI